MRSCEMGKILSEVSMKAFGGYGLAAIILAVGISAAALLVPANRSITVAQTNSGAGEKSEVERGRYLVEEVAKCAECHTPRDGRGELREDAWLRGAPIWIKPVAPISNWAGSRAAACRVSELYRGARGTNSGKGNWPGRRRVAATDAHLSHESRRRQSDYRVSQIIATGRQE